jgi:S-adenosylmethionine synthetase
MVEKQNLHKTSYTSESVTEGHPDKVCDNISDAILDAFLSQDKYSRVAVETLATDNLIVIAGEVTSKGNVDLEKTARETLKEIGYTDNKYGMDYKSVNIEIHVHKQSPDIAAGVDSEGAGDQGMMYGYACSETKELMPLPIIIAHKLTERLAQARKKNIISHLGPDGKSQVTVEYDGDKPVRISSVVIAQQHTEDISEDDLKIKIKKEVIDFVCENLIDDKTKTFINATGKFVLGGPAQDTGLTGRKIIVDTYGGVGRHGGGAFSGKDPTKVDRSAAYAARYVAKNIVAKGYAEKCEVRLSYAIGVAEPTSIDIDTFGTGKINDDKIIAFVREKFSLTPKGIINSLDLRRPIYKKTAAYGHFGREGFSWENILPE